MPAAHAVLLLLGFACRVPVAEATRTAVAPVPKVLQMLKDMKAKGEQLMTAEKSAYAAYSEWVSDRTTELGFEITTAERKIEELLAFITKADSDVKELSAAIGGLDGEIARLEKDKKDATSVREAERAEFVKLEADYSESVDALERAIQVLSAQAYSRPQAEALLQEVAKTSPVLRGALAAFIQHGQQEPGAPAVAAYDFQAGSVVEMLEGLLKKFKAELDDTVSTEGNKDHYYKLEVIHATNAHAKSVADREEKAASKAQTAAASAKAKGELVDTRAALAEDTKFLAEMKALFRAKSAAFEANQRVRTDELGAIAKTIDIISSPAVAESYAEHVKLAQLPAPTLLQTMSSQSRVAARRRVAEFLRKRAGALSSQTLDGAASEVAGNPFAKVIEMIESLLARLKEEAMAEATHKEWCDGQLKTNKLKRDKKSAKVGKLTAEVETLDAAITEIGSEIATLLKEQEELTKSVAEATKQRVAEKDMNAKTVADAEAGSAAVKQALVILREFYASQALLLQVGGKQVPDMAEYRGMHGENTGVVGMLEVIESDFARLLADTTAAETQAAREYAEFMSDAKADKLRKHETEVKTKLKKDQAEFDRGLTHKDLAAVEVELAEATKYYEALKPSCLEVHVSYEERVARRKEEIEALKQAYSMLNEKIVA